MNSSARAQVKKRVLVVMSEVPFPPRKNGLTLRYYPLLCRLSQQCRVTLAAVGDNEKIELGELHHLLEKFVPLRKQNDKPPIWGKALVRMLQILPFGMPFDYYSYDAATLIRQLKVVLADEYDVVLWVTQSHVLYGSLPFLKKHRLVIDAIDSISLHVMRNNSGDGLIQRLRAAKIRRWEASLMEHARTGFYISPVDRAAIEPLVRKVDLQVSPNGILIEDYTPERAALRSPCLGFLGNMSYEPNIDAVHRLYRLFIALKASIPELSLYIIGRDPVPSILAYGDKPDVYVTGTIDNIWPHVNAVDIFVMPMVKGAGQQNKLLEVMYAARPIIASRVANGGVGAVDGESLLIAEEDAEFEEKILSLLRDPALREKIGAGGARFVRETYDWDRVVKQMAAVLDNA